MIHTDRRFHEAVNAAVGRLEAHTDAEVVVVAAGRSGSYRDVAYAAASVGTLALLGVMLYVPTVIPPWAVIVELAVAWPVLAWLAHGQRAVRLLTRKARRDRQAQEAAEHEFVREAIHATRQRTGLLVYVTALEGRVILVADVGIEGSVPPGAWRRANDAFQHDDLDHFVAGLEALGAVLAEHVPPREDPDRIELADAPRVRA